IAGAGATTRAFATPTIVHFCSTLVISSVLSMPWPDVATAGLVLGVGGGLGVIYALYVTRHARGQSVYTPVLRDWIWDCAVPLVAYGVLATAAFRLSQYPLGSLFAIATVALALLFIGIHNSWDSVVYIAYERGQAGNRADDR